MYGSTRRRKNEQKNGATANGRFCHVPVRVKKLA